MVVENTLLFLTWSSLVLGTVLIWAMLTQKRSRPAFVILSALIVFHLCREFLTLYILKSQNLEMNWLQRLLIPLQMIVVPAFYLCTRALSEPEFTFKDVRLSHLIPAAIAMAWVVIVSVHGFGLDVQREMYAWVIIVTLVFMPYLFMIFRKICKIEESLVDAYSAYFRVHMPILRLLLAVAVWALLVNVVDVATGPDLPLWQYMPIGGSVVLMLLAAYLLKHSEIFSAEVQSPPKLQLEPEEVERLTVRLLTFLADQKPYLNPQLRLRDLAEQMGMKEYRLSAVIKQGCNSNFYELINQMRVNHAKDLLGRESHLNILGVAEESGFNSKSVFNTMFKKYTNQTPSHFRDHAQPQTS